WSNNARYTLQGANSPWTLLKQADKLAGKGAASSAAEWGLFSTKKQEFYGRSQLLPTKAQVLAQVHAKEQPPGTTWLFVPKGQFAVSCAAATANCFGVQTTVGTWWYLFQNPPPHQVVSGEEISSASSTTDAQ